MNQEIDWRDAPRWANYHAIDTDGESCWYENEPIYEDDLWLPDKGDWDFAGHFTTDNPETSLTKRPKLSRQDILDHIEMLQEEASKNHIGSNEAELAARESIADYIMKLLNHE